MKIASCQRGTASVEIVVMLPVFILLFLGVMHIHSKGLAQQEAQTAARACAYYFAVNGCTDDAAEHPICDGIDVGKTAKIKDAGSDTEEHHGFLTEVEGWPILGTAVQMLFGEGSRALAQREAQSFIGTEPSQVSGRFFMVCNTRSVSWSDRMGELLCGAASKLNVGKLPGC